MSLWKLFHFLIMVFKSDPAKAEEVWEEVGHNLQKHTQIIIQSIGALHRFPSVVIYYSLFNNQQIKIPHHIYFLLVLHAIVFITIYKECSYHYWIVNRGWELSNYTPKPPCWVHSGIGLPSHNPLEKIDSKFNHVLQSHWNDTQSLMWCLARLKLSSSLA